MKTNASFKLPVAASREVALAIIDQLPADEFNKVAAVIRQRTARRALASLRRMRTAVRKGGLHKKDFEQALEEVRAEKRKKAPSRRH